jgi:hypothetical protein
LYHTLKKPISAIQNLLFGSFGSSDITESKIFLTLACYVGELEPE